MNKKIVITALSSFSPLGNQPKLIWEQYLKETSLISEKQIGNQTIPVATISEELQKTVEALKTSDNKYKSLDNSVLYAILASREAVKNAGWTKNDVFGINIGSSRGATQLFEKHHQEFIQTGKTGTLASPTTTLGNISSWIAHDLKSSGPEISHSITCSTALHALLNGVAWLRAGMVDKFLVGGSEAPLTPFTIAQMQALKIYSKEETEYKCQAFDLHKTKNTMVLGEGAAMICLEIDQSKNALAYIEGIGYATDILEHGISISTEADCFQKSMKMALQNTNLSDIDVVVMHAPGTIKGDLSEYKAIQKVFNKSLPMLTTNKWKIGHTFGTSGMLSLELAILMMQHNQFIGVPFAEKQTERKSIRKVLVNAVGFGGNAVSVLLSL
ncbi:beta-ketoacyl synthase [Flavobacterium psychrophilum]|uniref:beta-ketoacyl synthase N-terminal-like domain-containing protein n=1 Tax=Flavobacterium psychrophilum TaxID=96345 RepID=UPI000B7C3714|nr:beta-ketoacyl synthase N-terminal-like domain-containing protein [Flavobacterium psychrophilum]EKT3956828.1 beta-ketoacyl synthase [Flavobacterium psychrophilum]EKT3963382.1 beta-ketoacyl synthase [Flavobacterium psychrophilum]EKT4516827.1 beta-ketoacyl synthase [Flavobacterium psychrophilum]MBF2024287.1 beta-ketoacyl synthase [Flavobacterium psychrophilum]MCB5984281.1 beta-ketoacyl synthase [Flavobacterium psychrophilum]